VPRDAREAPVPRVCSACLATRIRSNVNWMVIAANNRPDSWRQSTKAVAGIPGRFSQGSCAGAVSVALRIALSIAVLNRAT
jgi:hypothetical protein